MTRLAWLPLLAATLGCWVHPASVASTPALAVGAPVSTGTPRDGAPAPLNVSAGEAAAPPPSAPAAEETAPACPEAHTLTFIDPASAPVLTETAVLVVPREDDLTERAGSPDKSPPHVTDGTRTYALEGDHGNELVARDGARVLWRVAGYPFAGGFFGVSLSPSGHVVVRRFSRGEDEMFDARTGARFGEVGRDVVFDPLDHYALDPPRVPPFSNDAHFDRADVRKVVFGRASAVVHSVARLPIDPKRVWNIYGGEEMPEVGAAICCTGALYAVSYRDGELALYRASDDVKLASAPHPPSGRPVFTRSGRYILIHAPRATGDTGRVIAAYRLDP